MSNNIAEIAVPYAILALHDDEVEITEENIQKLLTAANITVEPIWISVFAKAFAGKNIGDMLTNISAGAAAAPAAAAPAGGDAPAAAAAPAGKAKKEEKKEESDEDMGFGLFD